MFGSSRHALGFSIGSTVFWPAHPKARHVADFELDGKNFRETRSFAARLISLYEVEGALVVTFPKSNSCILTRFADQDAAISAAIAAAEIGIPFPARDAR